MRAWVFNQAQLDGALEEFREEVQAQRPHDELEAKFAVMWVRAFLEGPAAKKLRVGELDANEPAVPNNRSVM